MKILLADNYYYLRSGSERVFFNEMEMLRDYGHKVAPFSRHFVENEPSEYSRFFASPIEYENIPVVKKIFTGIELIYSYECRTKFSELLNFFKPDVIHAHNIYGRLTTSIIDAAKKRQIPVVMTLHDCKIICPSYLMLLNGEICQRCKGKKFYHCLLTRCHKGSLGASLVYTVESYLNYFLKRYNWIKYFICPSEAFLRKHTEAGIPEEKLVYIPNFIKIENFEPNFSPGNYILFAGRVSKEKGVLTLLEAVKGLDVPVRIVGNGPMKTEYETYAKGGKIDNVIFEGYRSDESLKMLFRNAAFVVFPSQCYENLPMTILEAFAYGKPVIGSAIGGIPEMVIEQETGLLFEPGNYQELRGKIEYLLSNSTMISQMGKRARKKVAEEFNAQLHYQKLMKVYERIYS